MYKKNREQADENGENEKKCIKRKMSYNGIARFVRFINFDPGHTNDHDHQDYDHPHRHHHHSLQRRMRECESRTLASSGNLAVTQSSPSLQPGAFFTVLPNLSSFHALIYAHI